MLADGRSRSEVAELLGLSVKTVDTHRYRGLLKLRCKNEVAVVRWLFDSGIDEPQGAP